MEAYRYFVPHKIFNKMGIDKDSLKPTMTSLLGVEGEGESLKVIIQLSMTTDEPQIKSLS